VDQRSLGRFSVLIRQFRSKPPICWEFGRFLIYPRRDFDSFPGSASRRHEQYSKTTGDLGADITQSVESMSRGRHCKVLSCLTNTLGRQLSLARRLPASAGFRRPRPAGTIGKRSGANRSLSGHAAVLRYKDLPGGRATKK
jgi:hypothetical protein